MLDIGLALGGIAWCRRPVESALLQDKITIPSIRGYGLSNCVVLKPPSSSSSSSLPLRGAARPFRTDTYFPWFRLLLRPRSGKQGIYHCSNADSIFSFSHPVIRPQFSPIIRAALSLYAHPNKAFSSPPRNHHVITPISTS